MSTSATRARYVMAARAGLRPGGYASGRFQMACCPEPCLAFEEGDEWPEFVTMNPRPPRTGPQLRSTVEALRAQFAATLPIGRTPTG